MISPGVEERVGLDGYWGTSSPTRIKAELGRLSARRDRQGANSAAANTRQRRPDPAGGSIRRGGTPVGLVPDVPHLEGRTLMEAEMGDVTPVCRERVDAEHVRAGGSGPGWAA